MGSTPDAAERGTARPLTKGERTRERILDVAQGLFAQSGYRSVSLREIAARAGVTHAGVLHHFDNRDAILLALMARRDKTQIVELAAGRATDPGRMLRVSRVIVEQNTHDPLSVALYVKLSAEATDPEHPAHDYFQRRYRTAEATFTTAFSTWISAHRLTGDPGRLARLFIALSDGLQLQWALDDFSDQAGKAMVDGVASFLALIGFDPGPEELEREREELRAQGYPFS